MSGSNIQKLHCNIVLSGSSSTAIPTVDVPSATSMFKSLICLKMNYCKSLKLLLELPPYRRFLAACGCELLENVSFADQNLYQFDFLGYDDDVLFMLFSNCFSLNQDSKDNIEANAMLNIGSLAKKWASSYDYDFQPDVLLKFFCCFPGNKVSANKFEFQSSNSSLNLKIALNGCSGRRFLVFAICLVADLTHCNRLENLEYICEYQLIAAGGGDEKFKSELIKEQDFELDLTYRGDHVLILFSKDFVKEDKNYEEASFEFHIKNCDYGGEEVKLDDVKVEKCGIHVFYIDAESFADSAVKSEEMLNFDETSDGSFYSAEDGNVEEVNDDA
ncbi:disease resistance-like protein DSC1 [Hibiscus syriacus]|uniref:disease resistance-like protein DSC1 n=1 Tax=Hibiscus syriacus TaxID=106335 RepID=UPI001924A7E1|nr:disease resistance-like protein DSC1 [Hibiscus syriacus]